MTAITMDALPAYANPQVSAYADAHVSQRRAVWWSVCLLLVIAMHGAAVLHWHRATPPIAQPLSQSVVMIDLAAAPAVMPPPPAAKAAPLLPPAPQVPVQMPVPLPLPPTRMDVPAPAPLPPPRPVHHTPRPVPHVAPPVHAQLDPAPTPFLMADAPAPSNAPATAHTPAPASAGGMTSQSWESALFAHIARFKHYPAEAERRGWQGTPVLHFVINRSGSVLSVSLARSSGHETLDESAQASLRQAEPLPPPPASVTGSTITIDLPLNFSLKGS